MRGLKDKISPHCQESLTPVILEEEMRGGKMEIEGLMNGDWQEIERDRESGMRDGQLGHSDRAVD